MKKINLFKKAQISVEMLVVIGIFIIGAILVGVLIINNLNSTQDSTEDSSNIDPLIDDFTADAAAALGHDFSINITSPEDGFTHNTPYIQPISVEIDGNDSLVSCVWDSNHSNLEMPLCNGFYTVNSGTSKFTVTARNESGVVRTDSVTINYT